jgi:hypothetical protein
MSDDDWDWVADAFDQECRWDEWDLFIRRNNHPLLPAVLADSHPFTWFDLKPSSGAGYLQRLLGQVVEESDEDEDDEEPAEATTNGDGHHPTPPAGDD